MNEQPGPSPDPMPKPKPSPVPTGPPKVGPGSRVLATDVNGIEHDATALSPMETLGHSFPVVWLRFDDGSWDRVPWPAESVRAKFSAPVFPRARIHPPSPGG